MSLIQEVVESNIAGRAFDHVFVVEGRFTEPSDARRSVPVDDLRFYRPERLAPEQRDSLSARGYRICSLDHGAACPEWAEEPTALAVVMGIQETLDAEWQEYRLPFTWAVRLDGVYRHSGAGFIDVRRYERNGVRWQYLGYRRLWMDH